MAYRGRRSALLAMALHGVAMAGDEGNPLTSVAVLGHYDNAVGTSDAASQGTVTANLIANRPALRTGELLEFVPGMIVRFITKNILSKKFRNGDSARTSQKTFPSIRIPRAGPAPRCGSPKLTHAGSTTENWLLRIVTTVLFSKTADPKSFSNSAWSTS